MAITLPTPGQTNWDVPLNEALTDLDNDVTTINSAIALIPGLVNKTAGETWYRLVASSGASTNVRNKADYLCDGTNDQAEIQTAIDACLAAGGGIVKLSSGSFNVSAPIVLHPTVTLWGQHADQIFQTGQLTAQSYLKPQANFVGAAVILMLGQTAGSYASKSAEQRIFNLTIDGSASAAGVHGIQGSDYVNGVVMRDVTVKQATGKGIYTFTDNSSQPSSWNLDRVTVDNAYDAGIHFVNHSNFSITNSVSTGAGGSNFVFSNCPNSRVTATRAEWADAHGFYVTGNYGTGQTSGGLQITGCSTDRNAFNGVFVDATGNAPVVIGNFMSRRDGRNAGVGGAGYAGIAGSAATTPIVVGSWTNYPGVDDDGTGVNSPQYGGSFINCSVVEVDNAYVHANTAGLNNGGGNAIYKLGSNIVSATGLTSAPVRSVSSDTAPFGWFNVKDYGAKGDNVTDDTAAINATILAANAVGGGTVYLPRGIYKISSAIQMKSHIKFMGDGDFVTEIIMTSTTANAFEGSSLIYVTMESFRLTGPNSGTGQGIKFLVEFDYCLLKDITVTNFGSTGIEIEQPIVSNFTRVTSRLNGASGFYIHGTGLGAGTSLSMDSCWAHDNVAHGYNFNNMTYCALVACAADNQINGSTAGYLIDTCTGFSMVGCGSEGNNIGIKFNGGTTHFVGGFFCYATIATGIGIYVTAGCTNVQLTAIAEVNPSPSAGNWILTSSGTSVTVQGSVNTTANGLAANTTVIAANSSGVRSYPNGVTTPSLTMTGNIAMGSNKLTGLANGTAAQDGAAFGQIPTAGTGSTNFTAGNDNRVLQAFNSQKPQGFVTVNYDPESISGTAGVNVSGTVYLHKVYLAQGQTVTGLAVGVQTAGATLTSGQNLLGLYDSSGNRVGQTADQSAVWTSTGYKSAALTASYAVTTAGFYYIAVLAVGTTPPAFYQAANAPSALFNANVAAGTFRHASGGTGQTSLPATITMGSTTSSTTNSWAAAY